MRNKSAFVAIALASGAFILPSCGEKKPAETAEIKPATASEKPSYGGYESQAKWGEHLITAGACADCHTPKKMTSQGPADDSSLWLSGHPAGLPIPPVDRKQLESKGIAATQTMTAWIGPWGVSFAANITSDETGIGNWKEDQFIKCIRDGKYLGLDTERPLLPPMPWPSFRNFSDDELKAMFAYLKSTKPIKNLVPSYMPPALAQGAPKK